MDFDFEALRKGIAVAAAITIPIAVVASFFVDDDPGQRRPIVYVFTVVVLAGLVAGAFVAGHAQRTGTPMAHGIVTTLSVWLVLTVIRVVRLAIDNDSIEWAPIVSNLLLSLIAGTIGGLLGGRRAGYVNRRETT
jgi:putative membrane protein (TIGR04086 family)